jgi:U4/U6.U5 tri-snRNP-associated protein 1
MPGDEVIELSVQETNELRAKLGLAPLRTGAAPEPQNEEVLELSVGATNDLRRSLGLAPLRFDDEDEDEDGPTGNSSRRAAVVVHKPAENAGAAKEVQERLERARLAREVQEGIAQTFGAPSLGEEDGADGSNALSWAEKMRRQMQESANSKTKKKVSKKAYGEEDLRGIKVSHNVADLGSSTILTLADAPLLQKDDHSRKAVGLNEEELALENVELTNQQKQRDGLRRKRQVEMGMGRAGGYAGFDDDEFEELSGSLGPSRMSRGENGGMGQQEMSRPYGFQIGVDITEHENDKRSDLFAGSEGRGISLEPAEKDVTASDFMTVEEDEEQTGKKKKRKDTTFKKKKKKEKRQKHLRTRNADNDQDDEAPTKGLLDELEATAVETTKPSTRKRRRSDADDTADSDHIDGSTKDAEIPDEAAKKRARFDATMAKGNARTAEAFKVVAPAPAPTFMDDEPDDAFLNAALAKARRLRRLKEMSSQPKGAAAVAQALQQSRLLNQPEQATDGGVTFAVNDTREFTRALRARAEQAERQQARKAQQMSKKVVAQTSTRAPPEPEEELKVDTVDVAMEVAQKQEDIAYLAKELKDDEKAVEVDLDGTTASTVSVGRGMSNVLSMLRRTGEITGKTAGKEELRGRAKDKRTYEDYEALDLQKVVKIGKNATDKDKEFANREIKLEYRDEHGRLLTRKEAYRNLCYQFHGHGSGRKNEERRLRQIAREQAEARVASAQVSDDTGVPTGVMGALKATQKATGKAFVVHKT